MADILLALTPSLLLGSMSLLLMYFGGNDRQKVTGLMVGGLIMSSASVFFLNPQWTAHTFFISFLSGLLLGWGLVDQTMCLRVLGVSRTMPISTGAQLAAMSIGGVVLFGEWRAPATLLVGIAAIVFLVVGVWLTSLTEKVATSQGSGAGVADAGLDWSRGTRLLVTSTIGLVVYLLLVRWYGIDGSSALFPQALGYVTAGFLLTSEPVLKWRAGAVGESRWGKVTAKQVASGMIWGLAVLILQISTARVGVAVGFTLSQLGVILSTFGGILLLGEHRTRREMLWTVLGIVFIVGGAILAGVAKALDG